MHILTPMNNDATTNVVSIRSGNIVRTYTMMKGQPVASVWTRRTGSENIMLDAAREEIANYLAQGWKLV
jgi:hypothetical protein